MFVPTSGFDDGGKDGLLWEEGADCFVEIFCFVVVVFFKMLTAGRREARFASNPCKFSELGKFQGYLLTTTRFNGHQN